ncbi:ATP-grasp fold amidoligase family protein [Serratia ureilytica]
MHAKPDFWDEMIEVAQAVAADLDYCRVDFYLTQDRLYIGELTLTPVQAMKCTNRAPRTCCWAS